MWDATGGIIYRTQRKSEFPREASGGPLAGAGGGEDRAAVPRVGEHPHMRLVRDEDGGVEGIAVEGPVDLSDVEPEAGFLSGVGAGLTAVGGACARTTGELLAQLEELSAENAMLRAEVHHLRRRDDTVNYTMNRIDEELRLAAKLQRDFMPKQLPALGRVRFHSLFRPAGYVSGDLYDVTRLDERHVGFYMADAVGHGMPAALLTMFMRQALQTREVTKNAYRLLRPSETLARLNAAMVGQGLSESTFATAVCGMIHSETGAVMVATAGHPRPLLLPASGPPSELETDGSLLGIFPDEKYTDVSLVLKPGDRLVLYTDGVEVAFPQNTADDDGQTHFDADRWREVLMSLRGESAEAMLRGLSSAIDQQSGSLSPGDDLTLILVEMLDEG